MATVLRKSGTQHRRSPTDKLVESLEEHSRIEDKVLPCGRTRKSAAQFHAMIDKYGAEIDRVTLEERHKKEAKISKIDALIANIRSVSEILEDQNNGETLSSFLLEKGKFSSISSSSYGSTNRSAGGKVN